MNKLLSSNTLFLFRKKISVLTVIKDGWWPEVNFLSFYSVRGCGITAAFIYVCKGKGFSLEAWIGP
jgi:hypothetical protein